jgi:hypothetical protein
MIKDLSQSLVAAVNEINKKSREQYITERNALNEKMAAKAMKMPKQPEPKADPAAHTGAAGMAKKNMGEAAEGSTPRNAKEKELAKLHGNPNKITHGDVLKGRGVVRKEAWEDMLKAVKEKGTGKFDKKETKPGVTRYTRKSSTYDDGGQDKDMKLANDKRKMYIRSNEEVQQVDELSYETLDRYKRAARKDMYKMQGPDGKPSEKNKEKHAKRVAGYRKAWHKQEDMKENKDTPGNSTHQCAIHVKSEQYGEGKTLTSQHAEPDQNGHIEWYDVMFAEGIKRVMTSDIEVLVSEGHMNHKKKGKM